MAISVQATILTPVQTELALGHSHLHVEDFSSASILSPTVRPLDACF